MNRNLLARVGGLPVSVPAVAGLPGSLAPVHPRAVPLEAPIQDSPVAPDGSVYLRGEFTAIDGVPVTTPAKLTPSGALDTSFGVDPASPRYIGRIIVGYQRAEGSTEFTPVFGGAIAAVGVLPSGMFLVGVTDGKGEAPHYSLTRILPDGSTDADFSAIDLYGGVTGSDLLVFSDGSFFLGQAHYAPSGTPLPTFEPCTDVRVLAELDDGVALVVVRTVSDFQTPRLRKLHPASEFDPAFDVSFPATSYVRYATLTDRGKIVVSGRIVTAAGTRTLVRFGL